MKNIFGAKIFCTALTALMFFLILIPAGSAAIGVKEGDWAKYLIEVEIPEEFADLEGFEEFEVMEWTKVEVQSVSGTSVTLKTTVHYRNGTEDTDTMNGTGFIVDTDLSEGDDVLTPIPFGDETPLDIAGLKQRTYAGASREVYYVDFDQEEMGMSIDFETYWDKATGILCEVAMSMSGELLEETVDISLSIKIIETNLWGAGLLSEQGLLILVAVIIIIVAVVSVAAVVLLKRRKAPFHEVAPTPTE